MKLFVILTLLTSALSLTFFRHSTSSKHRSHHRSFEDSARLKFYAEHLANNFGVKDSSGGFDQTSLKECTKSKEWDAYFAESMGPQVKTPAGIVRPVKCSFLWMYTLTENQLKHYLNHCLRKTTLKYSLGLPLKNFQKLPLGNVITFYESVENEAQFRGSCEQSQSEREKREEDFKVLRCTGKLQSEDLEKVQYVYAKSLISTTFLNECRTTGDLKLIFEIKSGSRRRVGRDIQRFSAHPDDQEFLMLPGACFRQKPRASGSPSNEFVFEDTVSDDCENNRNTTYPL